MLIPIRCYTCGKTIAHLHEKYIEETAKGREAKEVLDELGLDRYCCRRMLITHVELIDDVLTFSSPTR